MCYNIGKEYRRLGVRRTDNSDILKGLGCVLLVAIPGGWIILLLMLLFS